MMLSREQRSFRAGASPVDDADSCVEFSCVSAKSSKGAESAAHSIFKLVNSINTPQKLVHRQQNQLTEMTNKIILSRRRPLSLPCLSSVLRRLLVIIIQLILCFFLFERKSCHQKWHEPHFCGCSVRNGWRIPVHHLWCALTLLRSPFARHRHHRTLCWWKW